MSLFVTVHYKNHVCSFSQEVKISHTKHSKGCWLSIKRSFSISQTKNGLRSGKGEQIKAPKILPTVIMSQLVIQCVVAKRYPYPPICMDFVLKPPPFSTPQECLLVS